MNNIEPTLIITHPGSAHFDEVTAISLILATYPDDSFRIERREPLERELEDPAVWVIDVGDRYEPEKTNFDHHQSIDCPASFHLVAGYLGLTDTLSVMPWWQFKDEVDRIGPARASEHFKAGDDMVNRNPVEEWLTTNFSKEPQESLPLLASFGEYIIGQARMLKKQIVYWHNAERFTVAGINVMLGETRESAGLEEYRRLDKNAPDIVVSMDRRSDGWRLYRYEGTPVNFYRLTGRPEIEFAHKSGFMAKTKEKLPREELKKLIEKAVIPEEERK